MNSAKKRASSRKLVKKATKTTAGSALTIAMQGRDPRPPGAKTKGVSLFERVTGVGRHQDASEQRAPAAKEKTVILTRAEFDNIVDVVEELADARAVTLDQLAVSVGVGKSQLSKIENQQRNGSIDVYRDIADALEVPIDALVL